MGVAHLGENADVNTANPCLGICHSANRNTQRAFDRFVAECSCTQKHVSLWCTSKVKRKKRSSSLVFEATRKPSIVPVPLSEGSTADCHAPHNLLNPRLENPTAAESESLNPLNGPKPFKERYVRPGVDSCAGFRLQRPGGCSFRRPRILWTSSDCNSERGWGGGLASKPQYVEIANESLV